MIAPRLTYETILVRGREIRELIAVNLRKCRRLYGSRRMLKVLGFVRTFRGAQALALHERTEREGGEGMVPTTEVTGALPQDSWEVIDFAGFRLIPAKRALLRDGVAVPLGDRALQILIALVRKPGELVSKRTLFDAVWPNVFVEESNLRVHIAALRKALGDGESGSRLIASITGRGYSFVGKIDRALPQSTEAAPTAAAHPNGVPGLRPLRIIGRDDLLAQIVADLPGRGLMTLTGAGGIGKTAVALICAQRLALAYRDGMCFVDLALLSSAQIVPAHLASTLRIPSSEMPPLDSVVACLRTRNLLLVLDNCDHVIDAACQITEEIRAAAPEVHILATSREPLRASSEWVQRLDPLPVPLDLHKLTAAAALTFPAIQLLRERILARDARFEIDDENVQWVAELCLRLDGLPLAIELAATQVTLLGIRAVVERLDDRFAVLTRGRRTALPRHQTLTSMIDWSYDTLNAPEQRAFRRLAVFSGSFDLNAAMSMAQAAPDESNNALDALGCLVEKSLLTIDARGGETRYRMLESIRLYGQRKLVDAGEDDCARRRHAEFCLRHCEGSAESWINAPNENWLRERSRDIADIRSALDWAYGPAGDHLLALKLTAASAPFWFKLLLVAELRSYLDRAVQIVETQTGVEDRVAMDLYVAMAHCMFHTLGPSRAVAAVLSKALDIAQRHEDTEALPQILWAMFGTYSNMGDHPAALECVNRLHGLLGHHPELPIASLYYRVAACAHHLMGEHEKALRHAQMAMRESGASWRHLHDGDLIYDQRIATGTHYARILWMSGRPDQAKQAIQATLEEAAPDQPFTLGFFLAAAAFPVAVWTGNLDDARSYVARLLEIGSGTAFNNWQLAGRLSQRVLDFIASSGAERAALRDALLADPTPNDLQIESMATYSPELLHPRALARLDDGTVNWSTPEVLRVRAEALLHHRGKAERDEAERLLLLSLEIARRQDALAWQLRTATSLARVWRTTRKRVDARDLLGSVFGRFTEGFTTQDLLEAKKMLKQLS